MESETAADELHAAESELFGRSASCGNVDGASVNDCKSASDEEDVDHSRPKKSRLASESGCGGDDVTSAKDPEPDGETSGCFSNETELMTSIVADSNDDRKMHDSDGTANRRNDRNRNKSTSAAVLLGLVKRRVSKLSSERHDTVDKFASSSSSQAVAITSSSQPVKSNASVSSGEAYAVFFYYNPVVTVFCSVRETHSLLLQWTEWYKM